MIEMPVLNVEMVDVKKIIANHYNPNHVAKPELDLLELSIRKDGYTQPIVCFYDDLSDQYIIVDGFHRYHVGKMRLKLSQLPVTVINKPLSQRMASTVRHNRARGRHEISEMANLIVWLVKAGWTDEQISSELGMEKEEILRLKQSTGMKEAFLNHTFSKSWEEFEEKYYKK